MRPITELNNKSARSIREVRVQPLHQAGLEKLQKWFEIQDWSEVISIGSVDEKADIYQQMIMSKVDEYLPEVTKKIASDDEP